MSIPYSSLFKFPGDPGIESPAQTLGFTVQGEEEGNIRKQASTLLWEVRVVRQVSSGGPVLLKAAGNSLLEEVLRLELDLKCWDVNWGSGSDWD